MGFEADIPRAWHVSNLARSVHHIPFGALPTASGTESTSLADTHSMRSRRAPWSDGDMHQVRPGEQRGPHDGCRRFTCFAIQFDTRAHLLTTEVSTDWEPDIRAQWLNNINNLRMALIHEFGNGGHERKIADFATMGSAPWTIIDEHNVFLKQIRDSFSFGTYYPALVGACALGERVLNELVIRLRDDYATHPSTKNIENHKTITDWFLCIKTLFEWGAIDDPTAEKFNNLRKLRNKSVHYGKHLSGSDARNDALEAIELIQHCIEALFSPFGGPPRFIANTPGRAFIALDMESDPLVKRFLLPNCVLVSPNFTLSQPSDPQGNFAFDVFDDDCYQEEFATLADEEFADHIRSPRRTSK